MSEERHTHIDIAVWAERNLVDDDGDALRLSEFQRDILDRIGRGERVVLYRARDAGMAQILTEFGAAGAVVVDGDLYAIGQAGRVWTNAHESATR